MTSKNASFMGNAFKIGNRVDCCCRMVGTIIGFILDTWFDTKPWLIIIFFFIGSAAGMLNVIRVAKEICKKKIKQLKVIMATNPMHQFNVHKNWTGN